MKTCQKTAPKEIRVWPYGESSTNEWNPEKQYVVEDWTLGSHEPQRANEARYIRFDLVEGSVNERTQELLWIGAFRYHLGRRTYAVGDFCDALVASIDDLPERAKVVIGQEIEEAFDRDDRARKNGKEYKSLGQDMDRREWEKVREAFR